MNISFIIPNYNGEKILKKSISSVLEALSSYEKGDFEIIVVDDCSTDNSIAEIKNVFASSHGREQKLKLVENKKNLGFASTVNRGVQEAKGEILVLLNTDVRPEKGFLDPLVKHFEDSHVFAVGCMDKSLEKDKTILRGRGIGKWHRGFLIHSRGEIDMKNTLWVSGGSGAFRRSIWQKLGGFDSLYNPFYWEDIDLSYRALKAGYGVLFESKSIVAHQHEKGSIKQEYTSSQIKTIAYRNQLIFIWKNITDLDLQLSHVLWLPIHLVKSFIKQDWAFILGFFRALVVFPQIVIKSFQAQRHFIKKDKVIVKVFEKEM